MALENSSTMMHNVFIYHDLKSQTAVDFVYQNQQYWEYG